MIVKLRPLFALLCLLLALGTMPASAAEPPANARYKVVFSVTENSQKTYNEVFGNFRNIQRELGPENVAIAMLPNLDYVQAGIVELIKLQDQGWAYIRP